jgi:hypothetical protein
MLAEVWTYFPDPRLYTALLAAGFLLLAALIAVLFLLPGARLHAALLRWRTRLGRARGWLAALLIAAPLLIRYGISTGFYILCPNIRFAVWLGALLGAAFLLSSERGRLISCSAFIKSAGALVLVTAVTQALLLVSADPFSLSW